MILNLIIQILLAFSLVLLYGYEFYFTSLIESPIEELQEELNLLPSYQVMEELLPTKEVLLNEVIINEVITPDKVGFDLNLVPTNYVVQAVACIIIVGVCYYYVFPYVSSYFAMAFFPLVKKPLEDKTKEIIYIVTEEVVSATVDSLVSRAIPETVVSLAPTALPLPSSIANIGLLKEADEQALSDFLDLI